MHQNSLFDRHTPLIWQVSEIEGCFGALIRKNAWWLSPQLGHTTNQQFLWFFQQEVSHTTISQLNCGVCQVQSTDSSWLLRSCASWFTLLVTCSIFIVPLLMPKLKIAHVFDFDIRLLMFLHKSITKYSLYNDIQLKFIKIEDVYFINVHEVL